MSYINLWSLPETFPNLETKIHNCKCENHRVSRVPFQTPVDIVLVSILHKKTGNRWHLVPWAWLEFQLLGWLIHNGLNADASHRLRYECSGRDRQRIFDEIYLMTQECVAIFNGYKIRMAVLFPNMMVRYKSWFRLLEGSHRTTWKMSDPTVQYCLYNSW